MIHKILIIAMLILLTGCANKSPVAYIPTPVKCPTPQIPPYPDYPKLNQHSSYGDIAKWCILTNKICRTDNKSLRTILQAYQ